MHNKQNIQKAKDLLNVCDAIFITAGAGMGVDSGLPDFRGIEGFWNAYPKAKTLGFSFEEMANPIWFKNDPKLAWAFYGHRLHLYRDTVPHEGFTTLLTYAKTKQYGAFVFTSNVDGQFQKAGFSKEQIVECHGSIHHLQCVNNCQGKLWLADTTFVEIGDGFQAKEPLPMCPFCGTMGRPNILMFGDFRWEGSRTDTQYNRLAKWLNKLEQKGAKLAIIEIGAGTAVPTVRNTSEQIAKRFNVPLIRINPRESFGAKIEISMGALEALSQIMNFG